MRHEYDDEQIFESNKIAARTTGRDWISRFNLRDVRAILDALPEPDQQDDWQACEFSDIRKGDLVKRVKKNSDGTISTIEGPATFHHLTGWGTYDYYLAFREDDSQDNITLYRIPAPVQHPDPAQHPVIIVHLHNGIKETKRAFVSNGESYGCLDGPHSFLAPHQITNWSPAKVVADND